MVFAALVAVSLMVPVSFERGEFDPGVAMPTWSKATVIRPLVRSATECIARTVSADPRLPSAELNDLIVDSMTACMKPLRAMIDAYDGLYGDGSGEQFFMGPYLDGLPAAVGARVKDVR